MKTKLILLAISFLTLSVAALANSTLHVYRVSCVGSDGVMWSTAVAGSAAADNLVESCIESGGVAYLNIIEAAPLSYVLKQP